MNEKEELEGQIDIFEALGESEDEGYLTDLVEGFSIEDIEDNES